MHRCRHLMVSLPPTDAATGLIRYAAMLAEIGAAVEFRFVCIMPNPVTASDSLERDRLVADMEADVQSAFSGFSGVVKTYVNIIKGPVLDRLLSFAAEQEVDLLLVGHQPSHSNRRALARRLAMKAPCSVWMVPDGSPASFQRMLVPVDFSEASADSLAVATSLADLRGLSKCLALHVYFNPAVTTFDEYETVLRGQEQQAFETFLEKVDCQGVTVEPLFVESANVPHAIADVVKERQIDLIVMSTRGRSLSSAILLGSETDQTIIETQVPILVVKHFGAHLGLLEAFLGRGFVFKKGPRFG